MMTLADPIIVLALRIGLALLLLSSAWHKLRDPDAFRSAVSGYAVLPLRLVSSVAHLFIAIEIVCGIGLLLPVAAAPAARGTAGILVLYSIAIVINLARGRRRIDCGCGGPAGALPLSPALVVRNTIVIGLACVAGLPTSPRVMGAMDILVIACAVSTFAVLYVAVETSLRNAARWRASMLDVAIAEGQLSA